MSHYLVYHSAEKMEHSFRKHYREAEPPGGYSIVTSKNAENLPGNVIWLVSGEGRPKDYRLEYWFTVSGYVEIIDPEFSVEVYGTEGFTFRGGVRIGHMPWFRAFRERMGNFGLGLQPLSADEVRNLTAAMTAAGGRVPT
jgi:hypothetical protein